MFKSRFRLLFSLFFLLLTSLGWADLPPITDADLKLTAVPGQAGAPAAILYREEVYNDIRHVAIIQERLKVLTDEGRKYADIVVEYDRKNMPISGLTGRTIHADGKVIPFEGKPFDKVLYRGKTVRYHVKAFTLPDVQVGSIIEYKYLLIYPDGGLFPPRWRVQKELWQQQAHFRFYMYPREVIADHDQTARGISWTIFLPKNMQPMEVELPNHDVYVELNANNVPAYVEEPYMPDSDQFRYHVHFYYRIASNPADYWKNESKFWHKDVEKFVGRKNGVAEATAHVVGAGDTPEQKVRKIYAFVLALDNSDFLTSRTEQEIKALDVKVVQGAEDVLRQKRGSSEDLNRLFIAMVRAAGVPAHAMRIASRENGYFDPNFLEFSQLDDEIAIVQLDGKDVFLDPGAKFSPYGLLDWRHTCTNGYRQTQDKPLLTQTPDATYKDAMIQRSATLSVKSDFTSEGKLRVTYLGFFAAIHRQAAFRTDDEGSKKDLEDEVKSWLPAEAEVKLISPPNWKDAEAPLTADFEVSASLASNAGKRILFPTQAFHYMAPPMFPHAERINGVYLQYPWREIDAVKIVFPPGMAIENLPEAQNVKLDYAIYTAKYSSSGNSVLLQRDMANNAFVFAREDYPTVKGFYDKVKAGDEQQLILRSTANVTAGN